jgi:predicted DNA-binding transcriptional regulator AlpA
LSPSISGKIAKIPERFRENYKTSGITIATSSGIVGTPMEVIPLMSGLNPKNRKLTARALCERYGVVSKTIDRWTETGILPQPMRINRYRYWDLAELEAFDRIRSTARESDNAA